MTEVDDDWPSELRVTDDGRTLVVSFDDGAVFALSAEYLRVSSPSAEVQGHSKAERRTVAGKRTVRIAAVVPIGNYAAKLVFDDGHDSGLFTWRYLRQLGVEHETRWVRYESELAAKGLMR